LKPPLSTENKSKGIRADEEEAVAFGGRIRVWEAAGDWEVAAALV